MPVAPAAQEAAYQEPAYEAPRPYPPQIQAPVVAPRAAPVAPRPAAPEPAPAKPAKRSVVRSPFGFFGGKKTPAPVPTPRVDPVPATGTGELFDDAHDEELEIPAFLRRGNR